MADIERGLIACREFTLVVMLRILLLDTPGFAESSAQPIIDAHAYPPELFSILAEKDARRQEAS